MKIKNRPHFKSPRNALSRIGATVQPQPLWDRCEHIAKSPDVLPMFRTAILDRGLVKEKNNAALLYLALTSRLFDKPIPIVVKGDSSGGKNGLVKQVLSFFPRASYFEMTGMSNQALLYLEESLKHRFLIIGEKHGMASEDLNYYMRCLISDGYLKRLVTVSAPGGRVSKWLIKKGPTGVITTTTSDLHAENETRMFAIHIDESQETTRRVMMALAKEAEAPGRRGIGDWVAFQKWLESRDTKVVVPFGKSLSDLILPMALRLRRDFGNLLTMIKAHALIHQKTRKRSSEGAVIAEFKDYDGVCKLLARPLAETVERSVPELVRETVKAVKSLKKQHVMVTELAAALKVNKSTALHRVRRATKAGYLVNGESRKSYPAKIGLGEPLPEDQDFLPSAKKVAQHHAARMAKLKVKVKTVVPKTNGVVAQQSA